MSSITFENQALFEHRFWLQILGDHARFILNSLSPKEVQAIQIAQNFISAFDQLLSQARQPLSVTQLKVLTQQAYNQTKELRSFKLDLLRRHLVEEIRIHLTPTGLSHMVNELEEYLLILDCLLENQSPPVFNPLHHHLLWLLDANGHASVLTSNLDRVEKQLISKSIDFFKVFQGLYIKAREMSAYLRTGLNQFPALSRLNMQAEHHIQLFSSFLLELQQLIVSKQALSIILPLTTDHMLREECYYLIKLAMVSEITSPNCDPTKSRIQS